MKTDTKKLDFLAKYGHIPTKTDFTPGNFVEDVFEHKVYEIVSWVRDKNAHYQNVITLQNKDSKMVMSFDDNRLNYYSEYLPNVEKPKKWKNTTPIFETAIPFLLKLTFVSIVVFFIIRCMI
jgi:hypothetical protein